MPSTDNEIIITSPSEPSLRKVADSLKGKSFTWVYLGQSIVEFKLAQQSLAKNGTYLDSSQVFDEAADDLRDQFLAHLYAIGQRLNSLKWWITTLSCRSGYTSKVFHQTCFLSVGIALTKSEAGRGRLVLVTDPIIGTALTRSLAKSAGGSVRSVDNGRFNPLRPITDLVNMMVHRARFCIQELNLVYQARKAIPEPDSLSENTTLMLCWATQNNLRGSLEFHESYFGDVAKKIQESGNKIAIAPIVLPGINYNKTLSKLRKSRFPIVVPHRYLRVVDILKIAFSSMRKPPTLPSVSEFGSLDIGDFVADDLRKYWISNRSASTLLMSTLVQRWAMVGLPISRIIYIYENQPWERALCWQAKRSLPNTEMVGYQHAGVQRLMLNFYLAPGESEYAPLPDKIVTVGKHSADQLCSGGYSTDRLRVGGAFHIQGDVARSQENSNRTSIGAEAIVLIAPSGGGAEEAAELVEIAINLFSEQEGIRIILKCHPVVPFKMISELLGSALPGHIEVSDEPITDIIVRSSLMVYTDTTACISALALGLPLIHLKSRFDFDMDPLEATPGSRLQASSSEDLREKVLWLLENREEYVAAHEKEWDRLVEEMYGPVTDESVQAFLD